MKYTKENYFEETKNCNFKYIGQINKTSIYKWTKWGCKIWPQKEQRQVIKTFLNLTEENIKDWKFNYSSVNSLWESFSFYWVNEKTNQLIRISNHWSKVRFIKSDVIDKTNYFIKSCGMIRSCWWELKISQKDFKKINCDFQAAITSFKKFEKI